MPTITYDYDLFWNQMRIIEYHRAAKKVFTYLKCVKETGGDYLGCIEAVWPLEPAVVIEPPEEPPLLAELLAQMPEDEQSQVATSILEAQARLIEQYATEVEQLHSML